MKALAREQAEAAKLHAKIQKEVLLRTSHLSGGVGGSAIPARPPMDATVVRVIHISSEAFGDCDSFEVSVPALPCK